MNNERISTEWFNNSHYEPDIARPTIKERILYNKPINERIEQIRKSHARARPTSQNPAWLNTHNDLSVALAYIDQLENKLKDNGICY